MSLNFELEALHDLNNRKLYSVPVAPTTFGETLTGLKKGLSFLTPGGEPSEFEKRRSIRQLQLNESLTSDTSEKQKKAKKVFRMCS